MELLLMKSKKISVFLLILLSCISASIACNYYNYIMTVAEIDRQLSFKKVLLGLEEAAIKEMAHRINDLEGQMEELGGQEDHLLSQYNELKGGLNVCKIGMKHDYQRALNQSLLVQVLHRKELLSTLSDMSQVNTQILELMEEKLELQEMFMEFEQFIPKNLQDIIGLKSRRHYLQSQSQYEQVDEESHDSTRIRKLANLKETKQPETTIYDYSSLLPIVVVGEESHDSTRIRKLANLKETKQPETTIYDYSRVLLIVVCGVSIIIILGIIVIQLL